MKEKIQSYIDSYPKHWGTQVMKDATVMAVVAPIMNKYNITVQAAVFCYMNDISPVCKNGNTKVFTWYAKGFAFCGKRGKCKCHSEEAVAKSQQTNLRLYGETSFAKTAEYKDKARTTNLKKFGVEHASHNTDVRDRAKETCKLRYGTEYPIQLTEFKQKLQHTKQERHGNAGYANSKKRAQTLLEKYNVTNPSYISMSAGTFDILKDKEKFTSVVSGKSRQSVSDELGVDKNTVIKYADIYGCTSAFTVTGSRWEEQIASLLDSLGVKYVRNTKSIIGPLELDFYLPDFSTAIEVNGNYWHCEDKKGKWYHFTKWEMCRDKGVKLFQYFEDEIINCWPIIESKIRYICKKHITTVGARKVVIGPVSFDDESKFLQVNHIQGASSSRNASLAAYFNGNIVGIISWMQRAQYLEITRFSTDIQVCCPGLFSKLLKQVITKLNFTGKIVSFSNNGHSDGTLYRSAGFQQVGILGPAYWYMKGYSLRENRQKYMKHKIQVKFNVDITGKTEFALMDELGYKRIWDAGKIKWQLTIGENYGKTV